RRECVGELESWRLPVGGFRPSWSVRVWGVLWSVTWSRGRSCRSVPEVLPWSGLDPWSCVVRRSGVSCFCGSAGVSRVVFADSSVSVPHRLEVSTVSGSGVSLSLSRLVREVSVGVVLSSVAGRVGLVGREFSVPSEDWVGRVPVPPPLLPPPPPLPLFPECRSWTWFRDRRMSAGWSGERLVG